MATPEQTVSDRARLAIGFSVLATGPIIDGNDPFDALEWPEGQDIVAVAAATYESAALTMHRIEALHERHVVLVTDYGTNDQGQKMVVAFPMTVGPNLGADGTPVSSVPGQMTVGEWVAVMDANPGPMVFQANGAEFAATINAIAPVTFTA